MPLTAERFAPYGDVIAPYGDVIAPEQAMKVRHINYGNTDRFHNLANLDLLKGRRQAAGQHLPLQAPAAPDPDQGDGAASAVLAGLSSR